MTPEEALKMPGAFHAYQRTDGEPLMGEYQWMTGDYDCYGECGDEPQEIEEVIMVPVPVRTFMCHEVTEDDDDEVPA